VGPAGVIRPIIWAEYSVNHRFPSLPLAIALGASAVVRDSSGVKSGVRAGMRPIAFVTPSVNPQRPIGARDDVGRIGGRARQRLGLNAATAIDAPDDRRRLCDEPHRAVATGGDPIRV